MLSGPVARRTEEAVEWSLGLVLEGGILVDGFLEAAHGVVKDGKSMDLKKLLIVLSLGHYTEQPFDPR